MRHLNPYRRFLLLALTAAMVFTLIVIPRQRGNLPAKRPGQRCHHHPDRRKTGAITPAMWTEFSAARPPPPSAISRVKRH